jgi:ABC-2 type transport system permease protein
VSAARAEWTKLRTAPTSAWLLVCVVAFTVALGAFVTSGLNVSHCPTPRTCFEDLPKLSLSGVWLGQVAVVALAVLSSSGEHTTRMIQTTLAAVPQRLRVLAAKAGVVTLVTLLAGALGVAGSHLAARRILPGHGFMAANGYGPLSLADEPTLRAAVGTVLYLGLVGLLAIGVATIARDTAAAITATLMLLFATPMLRMLVTDPVWQGRLERYSPMTAGLAVQITKDGAPIGPWHGLGVLAAYAGVALLAGAVLFAVRDP